MNKQELIIPKEELDKYYYEDFLSSEEIGQIYGKSKDWAKKYLKDHGYTRTPEEIKKCIEMVRIRKGQKEVCPLTKEQLYEEYIVNHKSTNVIAKEFNINVNVVKKYIRNYGITKTKEQMLFDRENYTLKESKEEFALKKESQKIEKEKQKSINRKIGAQKRLVWLNQQTEEKREKIREQKELLYHLFYEEKLSIDNIAKRLGTTVKILKPVLEEFGMVRSEEEIQEIILSNKEKQGSYVPLPVSDKELKKLYLEEGLIIKEIAEKLSCKENAIQHRLRSLGIDKEEEQKKKDLQRYFLSNIGFISPLLTESSRINNKKKISEKYNGHSRMFYEMSEKAKKAFESKESFETYLKNFSNPNVSSIARDLDTYYKTVAEYLEKYNLYSLIEFTISSIETDVLYFLKSIGIEAKKDRTVLNGKEIDLYSEEHKIGIEVNGTYWHSSCTGTEKTYHFEKSRECEKQGIRLIHIWEYEWNDEETREKIKSMLKIAFGKTDSKVYARKCEIREISNQIAKPFNDKNHLQGHRNAQITYGLYHNNELVQLMSFSYDKKKDWWEIIRGCPASNNVVVGGVSKLFTHFLKSVNPKRVFSYCDFNKFDGTGYEALGMKFVGYTEPDMLWLMPDGSVVGRQPSKHKFFKENSKGQIFRCGSKRYLLER